MKYLLQHFFKGINKNIIERYKIYGLKMSSFILIGYLKRKFFLELIKGSYSQNGEDLIIDSILKNKRKGFYVDIGAYHPITISNTNRFYKKGWKGINIEPDPYNFKKFLTMRKRDINLNIGVGSVNKDAAYYRMFPDKLSTFSKVEMKKYVSEKCRLIETMSISVQRLDAILLRYIHNKQIDFMSIDTEGAEMEILKSNNWAKYRPTVICIEAYTSKIKKRIRKKKNNVEEFLKKIGYKKICDFETNSIFQSVQAHP